MNLRSIAVLASAVSPLVFVAFTPLACSEAPTQQPEVGSTSDGVVVASKAGCQVAWTKLNYDNPGSDNAEFIELRVRHTGSLSTTLGACGLSRIDLLNGSDKCKAYRSFDVEDLVVPTDGYVVFCNQSKLNPRCDVSPGVMGWLENAGNTVTDEISFISPNGKTTVHGFYGGTGSAACEPSAGAGAVVRLEREFNSDDPDQVNLDCGTGFRKVDIADARPATDSCARPDGGGAGGSGGAASGGASSGGAAGATSSGGAATGGASTGGTASGGAAGASSSGGAATGGASSGGAATGGASSGGAATGGASTGGATTGGASSGGAATGGSGGTATGGAAGSTTGGAATGGAATAGTGGSATGGAATGGNGGSGNGGSGNGGSGNAGSGNAGSGNAGSTVGGSAGAAGAASGGASGGSEDDGGCGCRTTPEPTSPRSLALFLAPLALLLRRRR